MPEDWEEKERDSPRIVQRYRHWQQYHAKQHGAKVNGGLDRMEGKAAERIGVMGLVMDLMHVAIEERHGVQHAMRPKEMGLGEQRGA